MSDKTEHSPKRLPPIRPSFEKRSADFGMWSYDHRVAICVTIISYLISGIVFVTSNIRFDSKGRLRDMSIEIPMEEKRNLTPEQQQALARMMNEDFSDVRNLGSNENSDRQYDPGMRSSGSGGNSGNELNSSLRDDRGTEASQLYEDANRLTEAMRANRAAYEAGLAQEGTTANRGGNTEGNAGGNAGSNPGSSNSSQAERHDAKVKGRVTVSFSFTDPMRTSVSLTPPAYMCSGGGMVELAVTLDNNGYVTSASVSKNASTGDECMQSAAVGVAKRSRFNVDPSAPSSHKGTITYIFIPQ